MENRKKVEAFCLHNDRADQRFYVRLIPDLDTPHLSITRDEKGLPQYNLLVNGEPYTQSDDELRKILFNAGWSKAAKIKRIEGLLKIFGPEYCPEIENTVLDTENITSVSEKIKLPNRQVVVLPARNCFECCLFVLEMKFNKDGDLVKTLTPKFFLPTEGPTNKPKYTTSYAQALCFSRIYENVAYHTDRKTMYLLWPLIDFEV